MNLVRPLIASSMVSSVALVVVGAGACRSLPKDVETDPAAQTQAAPREEWEDKVNENSKQLIEDGKKIFAGIPSAAKPSGAISSSCTRRSSARRRVASALGSRRGKRCSWD